MACKTTSCTNCCCKIMAQYMHLNPLGLYLGPGLKWIKCQLHTYPWFIMKHLMHNSNHSTVESRDTCCMSLKYNELIEACFCLLAQHASCLIIIIRFHKSGFIWVGYLQQKIDNVLVSCRFCLKNLQCLTCQNKIYMSNW